MCSGSKAALCKILFQLDRKLKAAEAALPEPKFWTDKATDFVILRLQSN